MMEFTRENYCKIGMRHAVRLKQSTLGQCAQIGHAYHAHTITGYVRVNKVGAVSLVVRATDFSSSKFENSEMLGKLRLSPYFVYI